MGKSVSVTKRAYQFLSFFFSVDDCILATEVGSVSCDTCSGFQTARLRHFCPVQSVDSRLGGTEAGQTSVFKI